MGLHELIHIYYIIYTHIYILILLPCDIGGAKEPGMMKFSTK